MEANELAFDRKSVNSKILKMILPITIENVLQMTAGLVSMGMIGRIDVLAVSAIGIGTRIIQIIWAFFKGITTGATVFVSQSYGAGNYKKLRKVIIQTLISVIVLVIIIVFAIHTKPELFLSVFKPNAELMANASEYLKTVSLGLPFLAVMLVIGGTLQGMGNSITSMFITLTMNIVNIIAGYILIFGKFGAPALGLKGAAYATDISQAIAAFMGIYIMFRKKGIVGSGVSRKYFVPDLRQIEDVYRVGLPSSMEFIFWQIAAVILTRAILTYGETAFAAHQLGMQAESISYMPAAGFGIAATAFIGQALGAKKPEAAKIYIKQILKGAFIISILTVAVLLFMPDKLMALLTNNKEVIKLGSIYLILMGITELPQNITGVLTGAMRGAGYTNIPMIVAGTGLWGVRIPLALLFAYYFKLPIMSIWVGMCIDLMCRFTLCIVLYKRRNIYQSKITV